MNGFFEKRNRAFSKPFLFTVITFFSIFGFSFLVFAAGPFSPGQTLDPDCAPGDVDCFVEQADSVWTVVGSDISYTLGDVSVENFFTTNATTTSLYIGALSGPLRAQGGLVSTGAINLATEVTGILPTSNGGYSDSLVNAFIHASSTIAKTYSANTWTNTQSIAASLFSLTGLSDGCLQISSNIISSTGSACASGNIGGSISDGQIAFGSSTANSLTGNDEFVWDSVNNRLGVGLSNPTYKLDLHTEINGGSDDIYGFRSVVSGGESGPSIDRAIAGYFEALSDDVDNVYGIYATANPGGSPGAIWAGYFADGFVGIENNLILGAVDGMLTNYNLQLSFSDNGLGFNRDSEDVLGVYTNGQERARFTNDGTVFSATTTHATSSIASLILPNLTSQNCLGTDGSGVVVSGTCGSGGIGGTISSNQIAFATGADTIGGSSNFAWYSGTNSLSVDGNSSFYKLTENGDPVVIVSAQDSSLGDHHVTAFSALADTVYPSTVNFNTTAGSFSASSVGGIRSFGIDSSASGADINWAGFFRDGNVGIANNLMIGATDNSLPLFQLSFTEEGLGFNRISTNVLGVYANSNEVARFSSSGLTMNGGINMDSNSITFVNSSSISPGGGTGEINISGSIVSATWNGNSITAGKGGTGQSSYAAGDILYASTTNPDSLEKLSVGSNGDCLVLDSGLPAWGSCGSGGDIAGTIELGEIAFGTDTNTIGGYGGFAWDDSSKQLYVAGRSFFYKDTNDGYPVVNILNEPSLISSGQVIGLNVEVTTVDDCGGCLNSTAGRFNSEITDGLMSYGIDSSASGAYVNWAGFFRDGNVGIANNLMIGATDYSLPLFQLSFTEKGLGFNRISTNVLGVYANSNEVARFSSSGLTLTNALSAANGGTGQSSYTTGDILYASGGTALSKLAGVATGNVLISGGVSTAPSWGKIGLGTHVSGVLGVANGGTGQLSLNPNKVLVGNGTTGVLSPTNLHWDNLNSRLGLSATAPTVQLAFTDNALGFGRVNTNVLGFFTNGAQRLALSDSLLTFGVTAYWGGDSNTYLRFNTGTGSVFSIGSGGMGDLRIVDDMGSSSKLRFTTSQTFLPGLPSVLGHTTAVCINGGTGELSYDTSGTCSGSASPFLQLWKEGGLVEEIEFFANLNSIGKAGWQSFPLINYDTSDFEVKIENRKPETDYIDNVRIVLHGSYSEDQNSVAQYYILKPSIESLKEKDGDYLILEDGESVDLTFETIPEDFIVYSATFQGYGYYIPYTTDMYTSLFDIDQNINRNSSGGSISVSATVTNKQDSSLQKTFSLVIDKVEACQASDSDEACNEKMEEKGKESLALRIMDFARKNGIKVVSAGHTFPTEVADSASDNYSFVSLKTGEIGIGTAEPEYKLHVVGDVAAQGFVNISSNKFKKDINYLNQEDLDSYLEVINGIKIASYRYTNEQNESPLRIGLIAENSPSEILSVSGEGVDLYKLSVLNLAGLQALQERMKDVEFRLSSVEEMIAGQTEGGFSLVSILETFSITLQDGFAYFKNLFAETLTVGSTDKPSGITLFDEVTGESYCLKISNGEFSTLPGKCEKMDNIQNPPEGSSGGDTNMSEAPESPDQEFPDSTEEKDEDENGDDQKSIVEENEDGDEEGKETEEVIEVIDTQEQADDNTNEEESAGSDEEEIVEEPETEQIIEK